MRASKVSWIALLLVVACGSTDAPLGLMSAVSTSAVDPGNAGGNKFLTVMTWNLYLGAELGPAMDPDNTPGEFLAATTAIWAMVQKNDFNVRAQAIADEIAAARPDVIGLQEVSTWRIQEDGDFLAGNPVAAEQVVYDYLAILQAALAERGLEYAVGASVELTDIEAPVLKMPPPSEGNPFSDIRMTDHEVILVRADAVTTNAAGHVYAAALPAQLPGKTVDILRGWVTVDVKHQGEWVRFVSTHLDAYYPPIRTLQVSELATALADFSGRLVVVGDMNSRPDGTDVDGGAAYQVLRGAGLGDAWASLFPDALGYTSGWGEDLTLTADPETGDPLSLYERIDLVLFRGPVTPKNAWVVGDQLSDRVGGLWPSDHAGVAAKLRLEEPKFFALR